MSELNSLQSVRPISNNIDDVLASISIQDAAGSFVNSLKPHCRRTYISAFKTIFSLCEQMGVLNRTWSLKTLAASNLENLLDIIHDRLPGSIATKQNRCACFISFTRYLTRATQRAIPAAMPKTGSDATFKKIREKAHTKAFTIEQWNRFLSKLRNMSFRDYLAAKMSFQGAKRVTEIIRAKIEDIKWEECRIYFTQLKSSVHEHRTCIHYSKEFMNELKVYLGERSEGLIFTTRNGKPLTQPHLYRSFASASVAAGIDMRIHPHTLRTSAITSLIKMGYHSDDIMKISGHANPAAVLYYDKSAEEENITKDVKLC